MYRSNRHIVECVTEMAILALLIVPAQFLVFYFVVDPGLSYMIGFIWGSVVHELAKLFADIIVHGH